VGLMKNKPFRERELEEDGYWIIRQLSSTAFSLSGFAFTSMSVLLGFYVGAGFERAGALISALFLCTVLFMLSGEMAREAYKIWKYLFAEGTYLFTLVLLTGSFLWFASQELRFVHPVAVAALLVAVVYFAYRLVHDIRVYSQVA